MDFWKFNRNFISREVSSTKMEPPDLQPCLAEEEPSWHRLDALRLRSHPLFRLATDVPISSEDGVQAWPIDQGRLVVTAKSGISFIELRPEGQELCTAWLEYHDTGEGYPRQLTLTETELRNKLNPESRQKRLRLDIFSHGCDRYVVEDVGRALMKVKMPRGQTAFLGPKCGAFGVDGTGGQAQELLLDYALQQTKLLMSMKVYHGAALEGLEFLYEDSTSQLFGRRAGFEGTSEFFFGEIGGKYTFFDSGSNGVLDTRKGEVLSGFYLRAGSRVEGIQILTSLGRRSRYHGKASGGSG